MSENRMEPKELGMGEILVMISELVPDEKRVQLREKYTLPDEEKKLGGLMHRRVTGVAANAFRHIVKYGGTEDEVRRGASHLVVCIDAAKYHLDYKKSYKDFGISKLMEKYGAKRPKKTE